MSKESDFVDLLNKEMYELKIANLEAKLKSLQNGIIDDETLNMLVKEHKLYKDLEAKLAEYEKFMKDNEWDSVEEMQETLNKCEKKYFDIQQELAGGKKLCDLRYKQLQNSHQDKISFAVEQLKKVKEYTEDVWWVDGVSEVVCDFIDKQINELTGEKK